ncbi:hypothetical protein BV898_19888, partial [Hypsibius exemplaris]
NTTVRPTSSATPSHTGHNTSPSLTGHTSLQAGHHKPQRPGAHRPHAEPRPDPTGRQAGHQQPHPDRNILQSHTGQTPAHRANSAGMVGAPHNDMPHQHYNLRREATAPLSGHISHITTPQATSGHYQANGHIQPTTGPHTAHAATSVHMPATSGAQPAPQSAITGRHTGHITIPAHSSRQSSHKSAHTGHSQPHQPHQHSRATTGHNRQQPATRRQQGPAHVHTVATCTHISHNSADTRPHSATKSPSPAHARRDNQHTATSSPHRPHRHMTPPQSATTGHISSPHQTATSATAGHYQPTPKPHRGHNSHTEDQTPATSDHNQAHIQPPGRPIGHTGHTSQSPHRHTRPHAGHTATVSHHPATPGHTQPHARYTEATTDHIQAHISHIRHRHHNGHNAATSAHIRCQPIRPINTNRQFSPCITIPTCISNDYRLGR